MAETAGETSTSTIISEGGETTTRYAPYLEAYHEGLLAATQAHVDNAALSNPYLYYIPLPYEDAFHRQGGGRLQGPSAMPALFWRYNKHIAEFNITSLWSQLFSDTVNGVQVDQLVDAERDLLIDQLENKTLPEFMTGMRDINAVNSSTFIIGKALLYDSVDKEVAKFSHELRYRLTGLVLDRYKTHLSWQSGIVGSHMDVLKMYFSADQSYTTMDLSLKGTAVKWTLDMIEYMRVAIGTLQGATNTTTSGSKEVFQDGTSTTTDTDTSGYNEGPSTTSSAIGGALAGAGIGASIGGAPGAAVGAGIGLIASIL